MTLDGWRWLTIRELGNGNPGVVQTGPFGAQLHAADYTSEGVPFILIKNITEAGVYLRDPLMFFVKFII